MSVTIDRPRIAQSGVNADDDLRHGGHADHVGADAAQEAVLGPRLQVRPRHRHEHALVADDLLFQGDAPRLSDQLAIIRTAHVRKADAEAVVVGADERVVAHEVDVVLDDHQVALGELRVHAAAGVADDQALAAQRLHHPHRQRDLLKRIALVKVETAFHRHDGLAGQPAADEAGRRGNAPSIPGNAECRRRPATPRRRSPRPGRRGRCRG